MRFVYANLDQARQARKRLKEAVGDRLAGRDVDLTRAGRILAAATGYSDWAELKKAVDPGAATPWETPDDAGAQVRDAHRAAAIGQLLDIGSVDAAAIAEAAGVGGRPPSKTDAPTADAPTADDPAPPRTAPIPARRTGEAPAVTLVGADDERRITLAPAWAGSGLVYAADRPCIVAVVGSDLGAVALRWAQSAAGAARRSSVVAIMPEADRLDRVIRETARGRSMAIELKPEGAEGGAFHGIGTPAVSPGSFGEPRIGMVVETAGLDPVDFTRRILRTALEGSSRLPPTEAWYGDEVGGLPRETLLILRSGRRTNWEDLGPDVAAARKIGVSSLILLDEPGSLSQRSERLPGRHLPLGDQVDFLVIAGACDAETTEAVEKWLAAARSGLFMDARADIPETVAGEVCILSRRFDAEAVHVAYAETSASAMAA